QGLARTMAFANGVQGMGFDPNATLWIQSSTSGPVGVKADGSFGGILSAAGKLLTFDPSGNMYVVPTGVAAQVNVYSVSGTTATLTRTITTPSAVCAAAPGTNGTIYVALCGTLASPGGVYQYPAIGNGAITPIAFNTTANPPIATDVQGNVYA